jgi:hypothetical protein
MIPTLRTTLGVKGHRPLVGNLDCHDVLYVFGALNLVTGRLTTRSATCKKRLPAICVPSHEPILLPSIPGW